MQQVQLKATSAVELGEPLRDYIVHNYPKQKGELDHAIDDLQRVRTSIQRAVSLQDYERYVQDLEEYLGTLVGLRDKFPFGSYVPPTIFRKKVVSCVKVNWRWSDSFRSHKFAVDTDISFEISSVCFNIGAIFSQLATSHERTNAAAFQAAAKDFQRACGVFGYMQSNLSVQNQSENMDLLPVSLQFLSELMLAQATICTFESSVMKQMSPAILAMLATGVAELFAKCRDILRSHAEFSRWLVKGDFVTDSHMTYQKRIFEGAAQYWQSLKDEADCQYGIVIKRRQWAKQFVQSAAEVEPSNANLQTARKRLQEAIDSKLDAAVKDNNVIYHYAIPASFDLLTPIQSKIVVKPALFELPKSNLTKVFDRLVTAEIQAAVHRFKDEMSSEISTLSGECSDMTDIAKESLSQMDLPSSLDALESNGALPDDLWKKIADCLQQGGLRALEENHITVTKQSTESWTQFKEIKNMLEKEMSSDEMLRARYSSQWDRPNSKDITSSYYRDLSTVENYLLQAKDADAKVSKDLSTNRDSLAWISRSRSEVENDLPKLDTSEKTAASESVRSILRELSVLLKKRDNLIRDFIKAVDAHDSTRILLSNKSADPEEVLQKEKSGFDSHRVAIAANLEHQGQLMDQLVEANAIFVAKREQSASVLQWQKLVQQAHSACDVFDKVSQNISRGLSFYQDLLEEFLKPLRDSVMGFVTARDQQAQIILEEITRKFASSSISDRPPPGPFSPSGGPSPTAPPPF